jgi:hypothetical protein
MFLQSVGILKMNVKYSQRADYIQLEVNTL